MTSETWEPQFWLRAYFWKFNYSIVQIGSCNSYFDFYFCGRHNLSHVVSAALRAVGNIVTGDDVQTQVGQSDICNKNIAGELQRDQHTILGVLCMCWYTPVLWIQRCRFEIFGCQNPRMHTCGYDCLTLMDLFSLQVGGAQSVLITISS